MNRTFFWHDYETWGADPRRDRAAQFAGIRTDLELNPVAEPVMFYCAPADDVLPVPEACLITGITPQKARVAGMIEADFFAAVHDQLARPGTCGAGYNSIRFDDEITRFGLYRNFFDPYAREWQNGNSRWDIIDLVRLTRALRPQGIEWPVREDGAPSFRLEELTAANGIAHEGAHDALADVRATIAVARLIRDRQTKVYEFVLAHKAKSEVVKLLDLQARTTVLHVSRRIPARLGCISPVVPLAMHPVNRNSVICFDLRHDPAPVLDLDPDSLRDRLYTPSAELGDDEARIGLKEIHLNKCPVVAPLNTLTRQAAAEWSLDVEEAQRRRDLLLSDRDLKTRLEAVYAQTGFGPEQDPDLALYDGFLSNGDRQRGEQIRQTPPEALAKLKPLFDDRRLEELLFRYRARNWPQSLSPQERGRWHDYCRERLIEGEGGSLPLPDYLARLDALRESVTDEHQCAVLDALASWPAVIGLAPR